MASLTDFVPVFQESAATVRSRFDADINAGLATNDPEWVDTREGTFYWDITQVVLLELVRIWDSLSYEVPAAAFVLFAWGAYLDGHAGTFGLTRKAAVPAEGEVTFTGTVGTLIATGTIVSAPVPSEDVDAVEFATTASATVPGGGSVVVAVEAVDPGVGGNVSTSAVDSIDSPAPNLNSVTNLAPIGGGADEESDEALRERIILEFAGQGAGTINDYKRWALSIAGVGRVSVLPVWEGPGTVLVAVMTDTGDPVAGSVVTAVQNYLQPLTGAAGGVAPPGIDVTVVTPTAVAINAAAAITFKSGFSLDGAGGTIAQRSVIEGALSTYIDALDVGDDVIYNHVFAQLFKAEGVLNVSGVTVNGGTSDIAISASSPTQIATFGAATLS